MCDSCGCNITPGNQHLPQRGEAVAVLQGLLAENDHQALHNREHFDRHGVLAINQIGRASCRERVLRLG